MSARLRLLAAGPGVTLQDAGRFGFSRFGVTPAGPMDLAAFRIATGAVGATAAIEISLAGATMTAEETPLAVAIAGGDFNLRLDGAPLPAACLIPLTPGATLAVRAGTAGAWCYLAMGGVPQVPMQLGSVATHSRSGIGPQPLSGGDVLPILAPIAAPTAPMALRAAALKHEQAPIRVMPGPQDDYFPEASLDAFFAAEWRIGARSDRMAYALEGPRIESRRGYDIVSDGVAQGAIQITGSGAAFVLMADRQPTGGYPKIGTVIGADLGRLAQTRPGAMVRFRRATWADAVAARRLFFGEIEEGARMAPVSPASGAPLATTLLGANLVGGFISADE